MTPSIRSLSKTLLIGTCLSLVPYGLAQAKLDSQNPSEDIYLAIIDHAVDDKRTVTFIAKEVWDSIGAGDHLSVINATDGSSLMRVSIEDKPRYNNPKFKNKRYGQELRTLQGFVGQAESIPAPAIVDMRSDIPQIFQTTGELRLNKEVQGHMLIIAPALHHVPQNSSLSMMDDNGTIKVYSDGYLQAGKIKSPVGLGENKTALQNLNIHICALMPEHATSHEVSEVGRMWTHYGGQQGGVVSTFSTDIQSCVSRFKSRITNPLPVRALDPSVDPAMISADMSGEATQVTIEAIDDLTDDKNTALARIKTLEKRLDDLTSDKDRFKVERDNAKRELNKIKAALGQTPDSEVMDFSKFVYVTHETKGEQNIVTGVSYKDGFPDHYTNSWCYFLRDNDEGATLRFEVGSKKPRQTIAWETVRTENLTAVGFTQADFIRSRSACRFRED